MSTSAMQPPFGRDGSRPVPELRREDADPQVRPVGAALDVHALPSFGFSHRSLMWWGTFGMMAIEGMAFALAIGMYFYYLTHAERWPYTTPPPDLTWGTLNTVLLLASAWPNHLAKRAAERYDRGAVMRWLFVCVLFGLAFIGVRALEYTALNVRWDTDAYGSVVWLLLSLHTVHVVTDFWDTVVLEVLMFQDPIEGRRYVDVSENAMYWYFVIAAWLPIYAVLYLAPR